MQLQKLAGLQVTMLECSHSELKSYNIFYTYQVLRMIELATMHLATLAIITNQIDVHFTSCYKYGASLVPRLVDLFSVCYI